MRNISDLISPNNDEHDLEPKDASAYAAQRPHQRRPTVGSCGEGQVRREAVGIPLQALLRQLKVAAEVVQAIPGTINKSGWGSLVYVKGPTMCMG